MTPRDRLRETAGYAVSPNDPSEIDNENGIPLTLGDARKLLALVDAAVAWEAALSPDGSVMVGEPALRAAIRELTTGEG